METAFAGSGGADRRFEIELVEAKPGATSTANEVEVTAAAVRHGPIGGPALAFRFGVDGETVA